MPISRDDKNLYNCIVNLIDQSMLVCYSARPSIFTIMFQTLNLASSRTRMLF